MKRHWELDELIEHFTFLPNEMQQVGYKSGEMKHGSPLYKFEVPKAVIQYIAK